MAIDEKMLSQLIDLKLEDIAELVETVGVGVRLNTQLAKSVDDKMAIALALQSFASHMLEECGSQVEITITNPMWNNKIYYLTDSGGGEPKDVLRDIS